MEGLAWLWRPTADALLGERERWPLWLPVLIGAGILVYFGLPAEPSTVTAILGLMLALSLAVLARRTEVAPLAIAVLACAVGFAAAKWRADRVAAPILFHKIGPLPIEGRVVAITDRAAGGETLVLDQLRLVRRYPMRVPERVKLTVRAHKPAPALGARIRVLGVLMPPPPPAAPGSYDFARAAYFARIGGVGYAMGAPVVLSDAADTGMSSASLRLMRLRHGISAQIRSQLNPPAGPVAAILLTGDDSAIDEGTRAAFRNAGLAHLLSISGLHMALVAGIVFFALRAGLSLAGPVALRYPIKKWAAVAALLGTFGYLLLSGASYPAQRSFLMTSIGLLALMVDRSPLSMRILAVAATVLLLATPEAVLNVSFQLSFAAVAALIALYEEFGGRWSRSPGAGQVRRSLIWLVASLASGFACELALAPIAAYQFNRLSLFGALANLVAIPLFGLWVMPAGVLALLLMPFGVAGPVLTVMGWGIDLLLTLAHWVGNWPAAVVGVRAIPAAAFLVMMAGELWLLLWRRNWRWLGIGFMAAGMLAAWLDRPPDVLVERDGRLVAVRDGDGRLVFSSLRRGRFARDLWLRRDGVLPETARPILAPDGACGPEACRFRSATGRSIVYLTGESATAACAPAEVIITTQEIGPCSAAKLVVDRTALQRGGAHAIWLDGPDPRVETVADDRGNRPWSRRIYGFRNSAGTRRSSAPAP